MGIENENHSPYGSPSNQQQQQQQPMPLPPQQYAQPPMQQQQQYNPYGQQQYGYEPQYTTNTYQNQIPPTQYYNQQPNYSQQPQQPYQPQQPNLHKATDRESLIGSGLGDGLAEPYGDPSVGSYNQDELKFQAPKYQDVWFSILFGLNFILLLVVTITSFSKYSKYTQSMDEPTTDGETYGFLFALLPLSIVFGLVYVWGWLRLAASHAEALIKYTFIIAILLISAYTIYFFVVGLIIIGIFSAILVFFMVMFFISCRSRIAFTATILTNVVGIIDEFPSAIRTGYLSMIVNFVWFLIWGACFIRSNMVWSGAIQTCVNIYLVFTLYWVFHVIKNTVHTTVGGLFATWYFMKGSPLGMPRNPLLGSFRRATTTSFGSICFGSLIIAVIETLRYLSQMMINNKNVIVKIIGYIFNFILSLMSGIVEFFNVYAFTMVSIYGTSYCDSAKSVGTLFQNRLGTTIINDNFISWCISISALGAALFLSIIGALISMTFHIPLYGGFLSFFIGYLVIVSALEVVYSGVVSMFVCFVMEPLTLRDTKPELYHQYQNTYKLR